MPLLTANRFLMIADRMARQYQELLDTEAIISPVENAATLSIDPAGANNAILFTADTLGSDGNDITVEYVDPSSASSPLTVTLSGTAITVSLETNGASALVSTATEVVDAVNGEVDVEDLVTATLDGVADVGNDGSGVIPAAVVATNLSGGLHGTYGFIVNFPVDEDLTIPMADPASDMDNFLTAEQIVKDMTIWANLMAGVRLHFTNEDQTNLIDGFLSDNDIRVHKNFSTVHFITIGTQLLAVGVFTPDVQDVATITASDAGSAALTLNPTGASATVNIDPTGADNALDFTADTAGVDGNAINVTYVDPASASAALSVDVQGKDIVVNLATDAGSLITSTAGDILSAVNAHGVAGTLVTVTAPGATTGVVTAIAQTFLTNRNTSLTFTAKEIGTEGNEISIEYSDPVAASSPISVTVIAAAIEVSLETDSGSAIISTAQDVKDEIEATSAADDLVTVTANGTVTGIVSVVAPTFLTGGATALIATDPLGTGTGLTADDNFAASEMKVVVTPVTTASELVMQIPAAFAFLIADPGGGGVSEIRYDAVAPGVGGNGITIEYEYIQSPSVAEAVAVVSSAIKVTLATDAASAISSTVATVVASIIGSGPASALVAPTAIDAGGTIIATALPPTNLDNSQNEIKYVANTPGAAGDLITIEYVDPGVFTASTTSSTVGTVITVTLEHDGAAVVAIGSDILAALALDAPALALITPTQFSTTLAGLAEGVAVTPLDGGAGPTLKRDTTITMTLLRFDLADVIRSVDFSSGAAAGTEVEIGPITATLLVDPTGANNAVLYTAVAAGTAGNDVTIEYVDPGLPSQALGVVVSTNDITVNLETDFNGRIVSTADEIIAAVIASGPALALVTPTNSGLGHQYVAVAAQTNLAGGTVAERYFSVDTDTIPTITGGENGDIFKVNNIVERTITF